MAADSLIFIQRNLRRLRKARGMSQGKLAQVSGVSRPTIAAIEAGAPRKVKLDTMQKLADGLNIWGLLERQALVSAESLSAGSA